MAGPSGPATNASAHARRVRLGSAEGLDGRRVRSGDRVGCQVEDGHWIPASILHLEVDVDGEAVAWLLTGTPGFPAIQLVSASRCIRLATRGLSRPRARPEPASALA